MENVLKPYTIVTGQDVEKFEDGVNHLIKQGYVPYGNVQTSSVLGKGDIITVYTQVMVEAPDDVCDCDETCSCHSAETLSKEEAEELLKDIDTEVKTDKEEKTLKEFLTEPANATKKTSKKKK